MGTNEGKDARGASRLHAELGQEAFDMAVIELLGPAALTGGTMSLIEAARIFWNAGVTTAATLCDKRATMCGDRADQCDDDEDAIELKARAWQMKVMAAEINSMTVPNAIELTGSPLAAVQRPQGARFSALLGANFGEEEDGMDCN